MSLAIAKNPFLNSSILCHSWILHSKAKDLKKAFIRFNQALAPLSLKNDSFMQKDFFKNSL
ncbi:hypothetical protein DMC01_10650 [Campylobacter troglodytis]|nr:hypothetical protein DMC01_10650 [Campylobacter troglodytis]